MAKLRHFKPDELLFNQQESFAILRFFFVDVGIQAASLTDKDRSFAQALLVEAVDRSYDMGYAEILFDKFFGSTSVSAKDVQDLAKRFLKHAVERWFRHATKADLRDPKIYESVRSSLARNARSVWKIRVPTGKLTY